MEIATLNSHLVIPRSAIKPKHFNKFTYELVDSYTKEDITVETFDDDLHFWKFHRGDLAKIQAVFGKAVEIVDERVAAPFDFRLRWTKDPAKQLRDDQREPLMEWIEHGYGQLKAPPRWGKTLWMTALMVKLRQRTLMLAHLVDLAQQLEETIRKFTNIEELEDERGEQLCGVIEDWSKKAKPYPITLSTYQRFAVSDTGRKVIRRWADEFGLVVVDEAHRCFWPGTLVDGKPIESLSVGDAVRSYNHDTGGIELRRITHIFKHASTEPLVRIRTEDNRILLCTGDHPFWTGEKYEPAVQLGVGSVLYIDDTQESTDGYIPQGMCGVRENLHPEKLEQQDDSDVFRRLPESGSRSKEEKSYNSLLHLRSGCGVSRKSPVSSVSHGSRQRSGVLFRGVPGEGAGGFIQGKREVSGQVQQTVCFGENEEIQSDVEPTSEGQSNSSSSLVGVAAGSAGRKWVGTDNSSVAHRFGSRVGDGGNRSDQASFGGLSDALQIRRSELGFEDRDRGRREIPQREAQEIGSEKRRFLAPVGVASLEVQKRGDLGFLGNLFRDGFVYNIEVEGNHNYFAEGVLTHNCKTALYTEVIGQLNAAYRCGVTATPTRKDGMHVVVNDVLGPVVAEGYGEQLSVDWSWENTGIHVMPFANWMTMWKRLASKKSRNKKIAKQVVKDVRAGHFVLVTTELIAHMHTLRDLIQEIDCDITVGELYGKTKQRKKFREEIRRGDYQVVIAMNRIVQLGYNVPRWSCFHNTLPMVNKENWYQRVSRIRTPMEPAFPGDDWVKPTPVARVWCDYGHNSVWAYRHCVKKENDRLGFTCLNPAPTRKRGKRKGLTGYVAEETDAGD